MLKSATLKECLTNSSTKIYMMCTGHLKPNNERETQKTMLFSLGIQSNVKSYHDDKITPKYTLIISKILEFSKDLLFIKGPK